MNATRRTRITGALTAVMAAVLVVAAAPDARAAKEAKMDMDMPGMDMSSPLISTMVSYKVPDVQLVRQDGASVSLPKEMDDGRPVVLNFIYTTCASICPLMSQVFGQFQRDLGPEGAHVHLMSISIDPEEDTPSRLRDYARQFHAGPQWQHYTGTLAASLTAQRAFDVYRGDKMSHTAVTLMRAAPGAPWLRLDGFATPEKLMHYYRQLSAGK